MDFDIMDMMDISHYIVNILPFKGFYIICTSIRLSITTGKLSGEISFTTTFIIVIFGPTGLQSK